MSKILANENTKSNILHEINYILISNEFTNKRWISVLQTCALK